MNIRQAEGDRTGSASNRGVGRRTDCEYDDAGQLNAVTLPHIDAGGTATGDRHTVYGYGPTHQTSKTVHEGLAAGETVVRREAAVCRVVGCVLPVLSTLRNWRTGDAG